MLLAANQLKWLLATIKTLKTHLSSNYFKLNSGKLLAVSCSPGAMLLLSWRHDSSHVSEYRIYVGHSIHKDVPVLK